MVMGLTQTLNKHKQSEQIATALELLKHLLYLRSSSWGMDNDAGRGEKSKREDICSIRPSFFLRPDQPDSVTCQRIKVEWIGIHPKAVQAYGKMENDPVRVIHYPVRRAVKQWWVGMSWSSISQGEFPAIHPKAALVRFITEHRTNS